MTAFDNYLVTDQQSKDNVSLLYDSFNKDKFVPFIGAGCSLPLGGVCNWEDLFKKLKTGLKSNVRLSKKNDQYDFPKAFSRLYARAKNKKEYYSLIFGSLSPRDTSFTGMHCKIVEAFDSYITTNFDSPIEEAFKDKFRGSKELKKYYLFCPSPQSDLMNSIIYMHGHEDIKFVIIREEDYSYFYPTISGGIGAPVIEDFIKYIYLNMNIVFFGFSFTDNYVVELFRHFKKSLKIEAPMKHYLLISNNSRQYMNNSERARQYQSANRVEDAQTERNKFYQSFAEEFNIYPIVYKSENQIFLQRLCESLIIKGNGRVSLDKQPDPATLGEQ